MSELIGNIGKFLGGTGGKGIETGLAGAGEVGNIMNMIQRGKQYDYIRGIEKLSPQQLAAKVNAATMPLNAGLTQAVTNAVQGADAERGLATSPGIFSADLAQSLAPYILQNQRQAQDLVTGQWGLPSEASSIMNPVSSLAGPMANLFKIWQQPQSTTPSNPNDFLNLIWGNSPNATPTPGLTDVPIDWGNTAGANA